MSSVSEINGKEGYNIYDYWYILYARRTTIYLMVICSVLLAAAISWMLPPLYEAKVVFFVPARSDILTLYSSQDTTQVSRSLLLPESRGEAQIIYLGLLDSDFLRNKVQALFPRKTVTQLKRNVDFLSGTNFQIRIYVRDRDAKLAMEIANAYARLFNETLNGYSLKLTTDNRMSMEKELLETRNKLMTTKKALLQFKAENRLTLEEEELKSMILQMHELKKEFDETQLSLEVIAKQLGSLRRKYRQEIMAFSQSSIALSSPLIATLKQQLSDLEAQIASAKIEFKGVHPEVDKLETQYDHKSKDFANELRSIEESRIKAPNTLIESLRQEIVHLEIERDGLAGRRAGLNNRIAKQDENISSVPKIQAKIDELNWDIEQYHKRVEILQINLEEAIAQERRNINNVIVVDVAALPDKPVFPNMLLNMITSFLLAIIAGIVYVYILDFLDRMKTDIQEDIHEIENGLT